MKRNAGLTVAIVIGGVVTCVTLFLIKVVWMWMGGYGGMMGGSHMIPWGMVSGPWGWIMMLALAMIPLGVLIFLIAGGIWLAKTFTQKEENPIITPARSCQHCNKPAQGDWSTCPYCGNLLD